MAACMDSHACIADALECFHVNPGRSDQCFAKCCSQFIIVSVKGFSCHLEYFADKRESVAVDTGRSHTDQHISRIQFFSCEKILLVDHTYCKSGKIVLIFRHKSRMLCCLSTDQCCTRLYTALCHTAYDLSDLLRIVLAACDVIQEKQRFCACTCNVIYTHGNCIDSYRIMFVHNHGKFYLGSTSVCTGYQCRFLHVLKCAHAKSSGKSADSSQHLRSHGFCDMFLHQFN